MKIVVTDKMTNRVIKIGDNLAHTSSNYPIIDDVDVYLPKFVYTYQLDSISENITKNPTNYCYNEQDGFYDWVEPKDPIQEYRDQLASEVSKIGYNA